MSEPINDLALAASRLLWMNTDGIEDWDEWLALRDSLKGVAESLDDYEKGVVNKRVAEFDIRLGQRFPGFNQRVTEAW